MRCPRCQSDLGVLRTLQATAAAETRDLKCRACGYRATSVTFLLDRPQHAPVGPLGESGAHAIRSKIQRGEVRPPEVAGKSNQKECIEDESAPSS